MPVFGVRFASELIEEKLKVKEKTELRIFTNNNGDAMAEDVEVFVFFPPDFKVTGKTGYRVVAQGKGSDNPGYNAAIFNYDKIHINTSMLSTEITIEAPDKPGKYKIPVCICERNIGETDLELFLEVVG